MFIDQDRPRQIFGSQTAPGSLGGFFKQRRGLKIIIISLAALTLLAGIIVYLVFSNRSAVQPLSETPTIEESVTTLPSADNLDLGDILNDPALKNIKAETLIFGQFYQQPVTQLTVTNMGLKLPFNVKQSAANYYSLTRYINLDEAIENLNNNGFAVIDNPWPKEAPDYYAIYNQLKKYNIPFLVTNDFLIFYYQNSLKQIFKSIEAKP